MKLHAKIIPKFKHHVSASCGTSTNYCSREQYGLAETGQGNKFSGNVCRNASCFIINEINEMNLELTCENSTTESTKQSAAVVHVDHADLATTNKTELQTKKNVQTIINLHDRLYGTTGGVIESK